MRRGGFWPSNLDGLAYFHVACPASRRSNPVVHKIHVQFASFRIPAAHRIGANQLDRKSTRLNSSHVATSYAVFCLKKKTKNQISFISKPVIDKRAKQI